MPTYGPKELKCVSCGKYFIKLTSDIITTADNYCPKCLIKINLKKIKNIFNKK